MKLKDLIEKLRLKQGHEEEVEFLVYHKETGEMVCCDLTGQSTTELMRVLAKRKGGEARVG